VRALDTYRVTLAQQLTRLETLLDSIDPAVLAWVTRALDHGAVPAHLSELRHEVETFVSSLCDAVESAGSGPSARSQALAEFLRHASRPSSTAPVSVGVGVAPTAPPSTPRVSSAVPAAEDGLAAPTHTIAELISASDLAEATGTVAAAVVDVWTMPGYTEYRLADGTDTLVIGVTGRGGWPETPSQGQDVVSTIRISRGAASITEPIDPRRPSVLGAVPAEIVGLRLA
jgi:hypothetical protein